MSARPEIVSRDPVTGETNWTGVAATPYDAGVAVIMARSAAGDWAAREQAARIAIVERFAARLRERKNELARIISSETGKPLWESLTEVDAMINKAGLSIRAMDERRRPVETASAGMTSATRYKPHGVVAVLGPFNFPGHLPNGHIIPALLAGNAVVFKPSELTPWTAHVTSEIWREAGLPENVIRLVQGGRDVGEALVLHPDVNGIFFTGSFATGRAISRAVADQPGKIVALEMGGNNPLVVWDVADVNAAAYLTIQSAYLSAGQRCSCARRLIISDDAAGTRFLDALTDLIGRIRVGHHSSVPEPFMGPVISTAAAEKLLAAQTQMIAEGARAIVPMRPLNDSKTLLTPGLIDTAGGMVYRDEEHFGPLLQVIRAGTDFEDAIAEANETRFGLAAGLLSDDRAKYEHFFREVRAGVINWNRPLTGASSAQPFGGVGDSGNHRPSAFFAADYCSYPIASLESERVAMPTSLTPGIDLS